MHVREAKYFYNQHLINQGIVRQKKKTKQKKIHNLLRNQSSCRQDINDLSINELDLEFLDDSISSLSVIERAKHAHTNTLFFAG